MKADAFEQYKQQYEANLTRMKRMPQAAHVRRALAPIQTNKQTNTYNVKSILSKLHQAPKPPNSFPVSKALEKYNKAFIPLQRSGQNLKFSEVNKEFRSLAVTPSLNQYYLKSFLDTFKRNRYDYVKPLEQKRNSHRVVQSKYIGMFLQSAQVEKDNTVSTVLLVSMDKRFRLHPGDEIRLGKPSSFQPVGNEKVGIYSKWEIFKDKMVDVNLFR